MKDEHSRDVARQGDATDHSGEVIEGASALTHMGIPVALDGHQVQCPRCHGTFPIIATGKRTHNGTRVAYLGERTG